MIKKKTYSNKLQVILEYLNGSSSYKELGGRYNIPHYTIKSWVQSYRKGQAAQEVNTESSENVDSEVVRKQLKELVLKNALLEQMLKLAEEQTGIDFKKKIGTRQS